MPKFGTEIGILRAEVVGKVRHVFRFSDSALSLLRLGKAVERGKFPGIVLTAAK